MAERVKSVRYDQSRAILDSYLEQLPADTRRLTEAEIKELYPLTAVEGWRIPLNCGEAVHAIDYLIDWNFPYSVPKLAVPEYEDVSHWPHLFEGNYLCLLPNHTEIDPTSPIDVFKFLMNEAYELIVRCKSGELEKDFEDEFLSYWALRVTEHETPIYSLLNPTGPTRHIDLVECQKALVACEKLAEGQSWLANMFGDKSKNSEFRKAVLVWLGAPPKLKSFSRESSALLAWLDDLDRDAQKVLKKALRDGERMVVFGFDSGHGTALAGVKVKPSNQTQNGKGRKEAVIAQLSNKEQTKFYNVRRVDHSWVHGRDQDTRSATLKGKSVALIGCGTVGGTIAVKLAEAGVGEIHCIDPDRLDWGNVGRHELGAEDIGEHKSRALAARLRRRFPHLKFIDYGNASWQIAYADSKDVLVNSDLIVSTTGSWQAEGQLNELALSTRGFPKVLYGWTEAHAVAGHAVLIPPGKACLACNFEANGSPIHRAATWNGSVQFRREPACGTFFQPFGPIELSFVNSLISEVAVDALQERTTEAIWATWFASKEHVIKAGGSWSDDWIKCFGDPGDGARRIIRKWPRNPSCRYCCAPHERTMSD